MRLLQWNVQWCRGMDGVVDPARIASEACRLADPDVVCLQEIADNFPALEGNGGENQAERLARAFRGYEAVYAWGVDVADGAGGRRRFGNLILSRLPLLQVLRHALPWPAAAGTPSMPRIALEVVVAAPFGPLRVTTTHLEYYSGTHRAAQVERLRELHAEACAHARDPSRQPPDRGPFRHPPRPASAILCGDFNLRPGDPLHARLQAGFADGAPRLVDAWQQTHPGSPHPPTFRLHDPARGETPYCCDFVFVSEDLAPDVRALTIDPETQASDHQPVMLDLRR
ncbi:MAG: endonuclease/exonuclease/phosphatase family protein [Burkholderiales bacterium]